MNLTKPQKSIYNMVKIRGDVIAVNCASMLLKGTKSVAELQNAVNGLVRINDAFRLRITESDGIISQYIADYTQQCFEILEFENEAQLHAYADSFSKVPVGLYSELSVFKIVILPDHFGIIAKLHHLISDAWTFGLLATQFDILINGGDVTAGSYTDFFESEQKYIGSKRFTKDREFFLSQIEKCKDPVFLASKESDNYDSRRKIILLDSDITKKINEFAKQNNCSVFTVFSLVFSVYISKVRMNPEKFFTGTTILNRNTEKELNTAGVCINIVPLLSDISYDKTFAENLLSVEDSLMSVFRHQKYNYSDLLSDIDNKKHYSKKLFDVMLNYMNAHVDSDDASIRTTWYHNGKQDESLQLNIDDRDNTGTLKIQYDYRTEIFTESDIEILHNHLCNILYSVIENPDKKLSEIELLSEYEKQELIYKFNNTKHSYSVPENSTIYSLFEKTAKKNEEKICIKTADRKLTFGEVLAVSENLDAEIRKITNGTKSVIAVICERSPEMYTTIYGIIRGGNAYLPIDPEYPQDRIEYMLQNSGAALVLCQGKFIHLAGSTAHIDMTEFIKNPTISDTALPCAAEPEDTAYVIYTSGSTGNPKGAKISHKSAVNRILWMHDKYPLEENSVILQKTPYTFDVSVWEIFWWGMCGGSLAASKPGEHFLPAKILEEVNRNKVTHIHFVPSVFELFLNYLEAHKDECVRFGSVKHVFLSGEALTAPLIQRFYALYDCNSVKLHNLYGPTECAVDVTYYDCVPDEADPVPIGKPIYNTQMYVVDKYMNLLPIGVIGELCISGVNVGQGYLNNETLTAEKFVDNPFGEGKLYKTGDLAYWREDGELIFCGRMDGQIKFGGQRIETGEIEAVIGNIPQVEAVAVIIRKINGQDTLTAFYCGEEGIEKTIRSTCEAKMPRYMVPKAICNIKEMPLNRSGKLDRKVLSALEVTLIEADAFEEPINEAERYICDAFSKELEDERIGRNSNFFELGGSSLSMISFLSEDRFKDITPADFISNATPAKLAELMQNRNKGECKYLKTLYKAEREEKAMVLFPFAGGGAGSYASFVNSLKSEKSNMSIYFIRYLHSKEECEEAAAETDRVLKGTEVYFYSHCVGSAIAMQLLNLTELPVKHYIAGASIPPEKPSKKNIWNIVPDKVLGSILTKAGAPLENLTYEMVKELLGRFREDTDFATESFVGKKEKIKTPVTVVISKKDIFTRNYKQAEKIWKSYAEDVRNINFIDSSSHYFQTENSDMLVKSIISITD